jgi:hypothetical protein
MTVDAIVAVITDVCDGSVAWSTTSEPIYLAEFVPLYYQISSAEPLAE